MSLAAPSQPKTSYKPLPFGTRTRNTTTSLQLWFSLFFSFSFFFPFFPDLLINCFGITSISFCYTDFLGRCQEWRITLKGEVQTNGPGSSSDFRFRMDGPWICTRRDGSEWIIMSWFSAGDCSQVIGKVVPCALLCFQGVEMGWMKRSGFASSWWVQIH